MQETSGPRGREEEEVSKAGVLGESNHRKEVLRMKEMKGGEIYRRDLIELSEHGQRQCRYHTPLSIRIFKGVYRVRPVVIESALLEAWSTAHDCPVPIRRGQGLFPGVFQYQPTAEKESKDMGIESDKKEYLEYFSQGSCFVECQHDASSQNQASRKERRTRILGVGLNRLDRLGRCLKVSL